jgi:hypothetical protein
MVQVISERLLALECGLRGERAVSTWFEHLKVLRDLGFVRVASGGAGDFANVLLLNPYPVCGQLATRGWISEPLLDALQKRGAGPAALGFRAQISPQLLKLPKPLSS